jgi:hypothetical protein
VSNYTLIRTADIHDAQVTTNKLADSNVTTGKLASNAVTTAKIADSNVTTDKIADLNVTTGKLAADAVTNAKLADDAVETANILNLNVTTAKIADAAVTTDKLGADAVTNAKLADNAVETANIVDANVTTAKLADLNVTTGKLADDAVTTLKISDANITTAKLADDSVTAAKLADVTGVAMSQDGAGLLNVNYDDATVGVDGSDRLYVKDGGINTAQLADSAVTNGKINDGAVTTAKITDGNITTAKLADDAVTPAKLDLSANYTFEGSSAITVAAGGSISWATAPASDSQLANKAYVDGVANGLSWKNSARVATTENIDLSAPGAAIDGVSLSNKDRVLVWKQTDASQNGVYAWDSASTAMTRATDMDEAGEFPSAALFVSAGSAWGDTGFVCTNDVAPTLGTTAIEFVQFSGAYQVIAGAGLTKTGNTLDVGAGDGIAADADAVRVRLAADAGVEFKSGEIAAKVDTTRAMNVDANGLFVKIDATKGIGISGSGNLVTKFDASFGLSMDTTNGLRVDILAGGAMEFENGDLDVKDLGIDTARLGGSAVTTEKISDAAVTTAKINDAAVTTSKLGADAVTNAKLADDAVETANILNLNVTTAKLADASVTTDKLGADAVTNAKLADNAVETANIVDANVTLAKLSLDVQKKLGGYDSSYDLEITSDNQTVALPAGCEATVPEHLLFVNGRLMRLGAGKDYTISTGNIVFGGGFVSGDTIQIVFNDRS